MQTKTNDAYKIGHTPAARAGWCRGAWFNKNNLERPKFCHTLWHMCTTCGTRDAGGIFRAYTRPWHQSCPLSSCFFSETRIRILVWCPYLSYLFSVRRSPVSVVTHSFRNYMLNKRWCLHRCFPRTAMPSYVVFRMRSFGLSIHKRPSAVRQRPL